MWTAFTSTSSPTVVFWSARALSRAIANVFVQARFTWTWPPFVGSFLHLSKRVIATRSACACAIVLLRSAVASSSSCFRYFSFVFAVVIIAQRLNYSKIGGQNGASNVSWNAFITVERLRSIFHWMRETIKAHWDEWWYRSRESTGNCEIVFV